MIKKNSLNLSSKLKRNSKIVFKEIDGVVYILSPEKMTLHTLNPTASFVWRKLKRKILFKELLNSIYQEFNVNNEANRKKASTETKEFLLFCIKEERIFVE